MRVYPFLLVASTAILAHNTDPSRLPGSSVTEATLPVRVRSRDRSYKGTPAKGLLKVHESTTNEERARLPMIVPIDQAIEETLAALATTLHSHDSISNKLTRNTRKHLESMDVDAIERYFKTLIKQTGDTRAPLQRLFEYLKSSHRMITETPDSRNVMIELIQMSLWDHQQEMVEDLEAERTEWLQAERHPNYVFKKLHIAGDVKGDGFIKPFASPNLEVLKTYIEQYNKRKGTDVTLLDTFIRGFGGVDKLAYLLSIAKLSPIYRPQAHDMKQKLLLTWLQSDMTIDEVAKVLKLSERRQPVLTRTNLETITEYALLLDKERPGKQVDIFTYLIKKFGDLGFATLIEYARTAYPSFLNVLEEKLFHNWMNQGLKPEALSRAIIANKNPDVELDQVIIARFTAFYAANLDLRPKAVLYNFFSH